MAQPKRFFLSSDKKETYYWMHGRPRVAIVREPGCGFMVYDIQEDYSRQSYRAFDTMDDAKRDTLARYIWAI